MTSITLAAGWGAHGEFWEGFYGNEAQEQTIMAMKFLPGDYVQALNKYVTQPTIVTRPSDERQKPGNPGALLADIKDSKQKG